MGQNFFGKIKNFFQHIGLFLCIIFKNNKMYCNGKYFKNLMALNTNKNCENT